MKEVEKIALNLEEDLLREVQIWTQPSFLYTKKVQNIASNLAYILNPLQQIEALKENSNVYQLLELIGVDLISAWGVGCKPEPIYVTQVLPEMFKKGDFEPLGFKKGSNLKDLLKKMGISKQCYKAKF